MILVATLLLGTCEVLYDNSAQTFLPGDRRRRAPRTGQRADVLRRDRRQPVRRPAARRVLLLTGFALPIVFDAGTFAVVGRDSCSRSSATQASRRPSLRPRRRAGVHGGARGGVPLALAPPAAAHVRHRPRDASTCSAASARRDPGAVRPGGLAHVGARVRPAVVRSPRSAACSAAGSASRSRKRIGSGASVGLTLWLGATVLARHRVSCRTGRLAAVLIGITMFTAILWNVITVSLRQAVIPDRLLGRVNSVYRFFGWGAIPIGGCSAGSSSPSSTGRCRGSGRCGCRGSSPASPSSWLAAVVARTLTTRPHRRGAGRRDGGRRRRRRDRGQRDRPGLPIALNRP